MSLRRIIYLNWIADLGHDPKCEPVTGSQPVVPNPKIVNAVRRAIGRLTGNEQAVIEMFFYDGMTCRKIGMKLGKPTGAVKIIYRRAIGKLRKYLAGFVRNEFGVESGIEYECLLCLSPHRDEIDRLIESKPEEETWKRIIGILKTKYNIPIKTPQILIGHQKYHMFYREDL